MKGFSMSKKKQGRDIVHGDVLQMVESTAPQEERFLQVFESDCLRSSRIEVYRQQQNNTRLMIRKTNFNRFN